MYKQRWRKKFVAMILSIAMVLGMIPLSASVLAAGLPIGISDKVIAFDKLAPEFAAQTVPSGTDESILKLPDKLTVAGLAVNNSGRPDVSEPVTMEIPVTWTPDPEYNKDKPGIYTFTAGITGYTLSAKPPVITVTVGQTAGTVTAFDALADDIRWQNTTEPNLPETVRATVNGEAAQIPVTWEADHEYDTAAPVPGLYVFTARPDEGYAVAQGVEAPLMTIYLPAEQRIMARMVGGGTGTGPLEITTAAQLAEIAELVNAGRLETFLFNNSNPTVYIQMGADIDLSGYGENWNDGKGWVPIGSDVNPFKGSFDGGGKTITGLYINDSTLDYAGLFGCVNAYSISVHDMSLTGVSIKARDYVGGIAGSTSNHGVKVYNCFVSGSVKGHDGVGGMVGLFYGSLSNCLSACRINATGWDAGGVAGLAGLNSQINTCYAIGTVSGGINVGGVVGLLYNSVTNCVALNPSVSGSSNVGRMAGSLLMTGSLSGNAAFAGMTGGGSDKIATGLDGEDITAANIKADGTLGGCFTADNGWTVENGRLPGFGTAVEMPVHITDGTDPNFPGEGTAADPFLVGTAEKLALLATLVNDAATHDAYNGTYPNYKCYKLTADIDLSGYGAANTSFNGGKGWIPIGTNTARFEGYFDGDGKTVTGLYINDTTLNDAGLFGKVQASIHDLQMTAVQIKANVSAGAVVGSITSDPGHTHAKLERCSVSGTVAGESLVGGVAGDTDVTIKDCFSACQVTGIDRVGGVAGIIGSGGIADSCYATGAISVNYVNSLGGGIVGEATYVGDKGRVQNCIALGPSVTGINNIVRFSRVAGDMGSGWAGIYSDNMAFDGMMITAGSTKTITSDAAGSDGASKTADELQESGGFPSAFSSDPWTYEPGRLPGLFGKTVDMPAHITARLTSFFAGGDGSSSHPYQIATAAQLAKLAELVNNPATNVAYGGTDIYYKLIADLDISGYGASFNGGKGWVPIGRAETAPFKGHLDGNHKAISGLYLNDEFQYNCAGGLFGYLINSKVYDLAITDVNITTTGMGSVGVVAGYMDLGVVQGCYTTGAISGGFGGVGGIAGTAELSGVVQNCYTTVAVSGSGSMGGIVGTAGTSGFGVTVQNCYVTGNFNGGSNAGGVAGFLVTSTIQNCVVLSPGLTQDDWVKRILGRGDVTNTLTNNHAFSGMLSGGTDKTAGGLDGADVSIQTAMSGTSFWQDTMNWDTSVWTITSGKLPTITGFPGQSGDGGLYLTQRDIANATVTLNGSCTYTGSLITPDLTVSFDGTILVKGADYIVTITSADDSGASAGTNAGTVTLTLTGIGNFTGERTGVSYTIEPKGLTIGMITIIGAPFAYTGMAQTPAAVKDGAATLVADTDYEAAYTGNLNAGTANVSITGKGNYQGTVSKSFTIEKRPIAVKADDISMTRGGTLPVFTYTADGQLSGETAFTGNPILACATDGKTAGSYSITVDLTGVSYTSNYIAASPAFIGGTLTVNNSSSGGLGGSPSSGGASSGGDSITIAPASRPNQPVTATVSVTATTGTNGSASAPISDKAIADAVAKAQADAKVQNRAENGVGVALNVTMPQGSTALSLSLSQNALQSLVNAGTSSFDINGAPISLSLDLKALQEIQKQSTGNVTISFTPAANLSAAAQNLIGTRPVYNVTISFVKDGKTVNLTSLGSGTATLSIPYTPGKNEAVGYLFGVCVDGGKGNATRIEGSTYDANSKSIIFDSNHFLVYGVGYAAPSDKFKDISSHWAKEFIDYVVGRGLLSGTSTAAFSPNTAMSRGMLVTALGRLTGVDIGDYKTVSFTDVEADKYYTPYIEWAYKKGIVSGIGNSKFAPDRDITREEIALIFSNYAKATGYTLPVTLEAVAFADDDRIGSTYKEAIKVMQQAGIMMGGNGNKFNPKANTTRAEVSAMLHRYIKLTIDPTTAQGWAVNDAGQRLYYKAGKALTGWQTIESKKYFFDSDGMMKTGWKKDDKGNWYYLSVKGGLVGWQGIDIGNSKKRYYFTEDAVMVSGKWLKLHKKWYYFNIDGSLAVSTKIDGYEVDENGVRKTK